METPDENSFLNFRLMRCLMAVTPNYTTEQTAEITGLYENGTTVENIAVAVGKSVRSIRSKLVREGVYVAKPKPEAKKVDGPSKKEILRSLEDTTFDTKGFEGATKNALTRLLGMVSN
jgi:hypothetical protein